MDGYVDRQALQDIADAIRTKNGSKETYKPSEMAGAILNIGGNPNLQDKQVTITENGTQTITADKGFEGLSSVEVNSEVWEGFGFSEIYDDDFANNINQYYKDRIEYASKIMMMDWNKSNCSNLFIDDLDLIFFPSVNFYYITNTRGMFENCINLQTIPDNLYTKNIIECARMFRNCHMLRGIISLDLSNASNFTRLFESCFNLTGANLNTTEKLTDLYYSFYNCISLKKISLNTNNVVNFGGTFFGCKKLEEIYLTTFNYVEGTDAFSGCSALKELRFTNWGKKDVNLIDSPQLSPFSIHYILQNATKITEGATARTLVLNATAKTNWKNSEYYQEDLAVLTDKGITIV